MGKKRRLKDDFPTQKEWLEGLSDAEIERFILGGCCYDVETGEGKRVLTLRAARKYTIDQLHMILDYMTMSDKLDILENEKDIISFGNIMKALKEKTPPPTPEEEARMQKFFEEFERTHPDFFAPIEGEEEE